MEIDISFKDEDSKIYSTAAFSNLFPYEFEIDDVKCSSIEGFLRCLTVDDSNNLGEMAKRSICKLSGLNAYKIRYQLRDWRKTQTIFWKQTEIKRDSKAYDQLITKAYDGLFKNHLFRLVLSSVDCEDTLIHSIGGNDKTKTLLTAEEYIWQLNRLIKLL